MRDWPFQLTVTDICYKNVKMQAHFPNVLERTPPGRNRLVIAFWLITLYLSVPRIVLSL
jgi:hypothetical protein